jgi:hypothetical protein
MRTPIHEFKDTTGIALSKYGSDVSLGLCQVQVSNAILLDMGLNPEKFASYSREQQAAIKKDVVAKMDEGLKEYYINKLQDPLTNLDYAARYLEFLGKARDYKTPELWLSDYNRGLSTYTTSLPYGDRYDWIEENYDFGDYE